MWIFVGGVATGFALAYLIGIIISKLFPEIKISSQLDAHGIIQVIDKRMGEGWCKELADQLK